MESPASTLSLHQASAVAELPAPCASGCSRPSSLGISRAMTRCECAEISFAEIARRIDGGSTLSKVMKATGCASTCTACLPDLERYLGSR